MAGDQISENIYPLPDVTTRPETFHEYTQNLKANHVPIVIDNGSYQCRAGWATDDKPKLIFKSLIAKQRGKKDYEVEVGNDISNIEGVRWLLKTQYDRNIVCQFDVQEIIFDHIFSHLGIDTVGCVDHPIVLTEALCNPSYCRQLMSELLFECYQVPQISYGIDSLFSFNYNSRKFKGDCGIIVSCSFQTCHILPVLHGRIDVNNAVRLNIGGNHLTTLFHRLLLLKYPVHFSSITLSRAECFVHKHSYFAENYLEELEQWSDIDFYQKNVHCIQLPYNPQQTSKRAPGVNEPEVQHFEALLKRMQGIYSKKMVEKLTVFEVRLQNLITLQELIEDEDEDSYLKILEDSGYESEETLQTAINLLNRQIHKIRSSVPSLNISDVPSKWPDELRSERFSDVESWIAYVRQMKKELIESVRLKQKSKQPAREEKPILDISQPKGSGSLWSTCLFEEPQEETVKMEPETDEADDDIQEKLNFLDEMLLEYERESQRKQKLGSGNSFSFNLAEYYQLKMDVERIRIPEILFQPSIIAQEQRGISEALESVFNHYQPYHQNLLANNIFLTGGCAEIPGFKQRVSVNVMAMRPFQSKFSVLIADDPLLDAWKGASNWARNFDNLEKYGITKLEYEEKGGDYLKEHSLSNMFVSFPKANINLVSDVK